MTDHPNLRRWYWRWHVEIGFAVIAVCLVVGAASIISSRGDIAREARSGAQAHRALCALRADYLHRVHDSRKYLSETPRQRVKQFGPALGRIPPATVRASLANQLQTLDTLGGLRC